MASTKSNFISLWLLVLGIIGTYSCSMVAAGHGVIFVGFLLILGWKHWLIPVLTGWIGIVFLIGGSLLGRPNLLSQVGIASISVSWVIFLWDSEMLTNLITSIPFFICLFY